MIEIIVIATLRTTERDFATDFVQLLQKMPACLLQPNSCFSRILCVSSCM